MEEVHKRHPGGFGRRCRGLGVGLQTRVVFASVGQVGILEVLVGDRAEKHDSREGLAVGLRGAGVFDELHEFFRVGRRFFHPGVRLVVAEECEHDVRFDVAQNLAVGRHAFAPRKRVHLVAAEAHVADAHLLTAEPALEQGFKPAVVVHPIRQSVAHHGHRFPRLKNERGGIAVAFRDGHGRLGFDGGRGFCRRGGGLGFGCRAGRRGFRGGFRGWDDVVVCRDRAAEVGVIRGFYPLRVAPETVCVGFVGPDKSNLRLGLDLVLKAHRPVDPVEDHPAITRVDDVFGSAVEGGENAARFTVGGGVAAGPFAGHRLLGVVRGRARFHAVEGLGQGQDVPIGSRFRRVSPGLDVDVFDAPQNREGGFLRQRGDPRALLVVFPVMPHPCLAQNLMAEPEPEIWPLVFVVVLEKRIVLFAVAEAVGGRAQPHHRTASLEIRVEVFHLLGRRRKEPCENHQPVGFLQCLHARDIRGAGLDLAFFVEAEEHRAIKPVVFCQEPRQGRDGFLRAILVVARDQDQFFAFGGSARGIDEGVG